MKYNGIFKLSKEVLKNYYLTQKMTLRELASLYGVSHITARKWLIKYDIPIRRNWLQKLIKTKKEREKK